MTWYSPQEIKDEAVGDRRQPEFPPPPDPDFDTVEGGPSPKLGRLVSRVNAVAAIVASEIDNFPPDAA